MGSGERARVIVWGTGNVGMHGLRHALDHPAIDVVGLHAHSVAKLGKDAGDLCGLGRKAGISATNDVDALIALKPDAALYFANGELRVEAAVADIARLLEAGINVLSVALIVLIYPPNAHASIREPLEAACAKGGSTLFVNGIDPGFSGDLLPLTALSIADAVEQITVQEIFDYSTYEDPDFTAVAFGFGQGPEAEPPIAMPGAIAGSWGGMLRMIADAMGQELDEISESYERYYAQETFTCAMGHIEKGTCSAVRFKAEGLVDGKAFITAEHVNRLGETEAPAWPMPPVGKSGVHRAIVKGTPDITLECFVSGPDGDHNNGGIHATGLRIINAIHEVIAHSPGIVSALDLPYTFSRNAVRKKD